MITPGKDNIKDNKLSGSFAKEKILSAAKTAITTYINLLSIS